MIKPFALCVLVAGMSAVLASCAMSPDLPPDANRLAADKLPTPFTADEIRRACTGRRLRFEIVNNGTSRHETWEFTESDAQGTRVHTIKAQGEGEERTSGRSTWAALQAHASFDAERTRVSSEELETEMGTLATWRYDVRGQKGGEQRFWFAKKLPGPPVLLEQVVGQRIVMRMRMIESSQQ